MDFPKNRMKITKHKGTRTSEAGWLTLNIKGIDLDGVNEISISMDDVSKLLSEPVQDDPLSILAQFIEKQQQDTEE